MEVPPAAMDPLGGLPAPAELRSEGGRGDSFSRLKDWVRSLSQHEGGIKRAGCCLSLEHRHAVLHFLWQESQEGVRKRRAKELLDALAQVQEFAGGVSIEKEWDVKKPECSCGEGSLPWASCPDVQQGPPADSGLPSAWEFEDPQADGRDVFQRLRAFVRSERKAGRLEAAGLALGSSYRRRVFEFLAAFFRKKTVFRGQAWEMLRRLEGHVSWRQGGAAAGAAVAAALAEGPPPGAEAQRAAEDSTASSASSMGTPRAPSLDIKVAPQQSHQPTGHVGVSGEGKLKMEDTQCGRSTPLMHLCTC